ncbi:hypothetical protein EDB85DRAFT_1943400 [Lactarius pseudohatsudake]|nr:hypothetical protein EDB85DRAFT_1943400 [Lactarius pseudohatsudake]
MKFLGTIVALSLAAVALAAPMAPRGGIDLGLLGYLGYTISELLEDLGCTVEVLAKNLGCTVEVLLANLDITLYALLGLLGKY